MKKILPLILAAVLLCGIAPAETVDLSALTFEDLAALRDRCQLEMMTRDFWQEVTVPQGVYQVGVQIPAGTWTVRCGEGSLLTFSWGEALEDNGQEIDIDGRFDFESIYNPNHKYYDAGDRTEYTFTVREGDWIVIRNAPAVFTPGGVTPAFTFK